MTREELVQMREYQVAQASNEYWKKNMDNDDVSIMTAFEDGVAWADEHQKNPWISVEERLPEKEDGKFDMSAEVLVRTEDYPKYIVAAYDHRYNRWWATYELEKVTHWMPIPKLEN